MAEYQRRYNPNRATQWNYGGAKWRLSRSKIDYFLECPRCFYIDNKLGTKRPGMPSFNLNIAVDELFKKEFDIHRKAKTQHPIMKEYGVDAVPFVHKHMDMWRENFEGIECLHKNTGLTVSGAIDDIWENKDGELIVVDYKATSKDTAIKTMDDISWGKQYTRQISIYQWLLKQNGFKVSSTGYFVYANASKNKKTFDNILTFETTLVSCEGDDSWIENTLTKIKACLECDTYPDSGTQCEFCPYREASGKKLLGIHTKNKKKETTEDASSPGSPADTVAAIKKKYA